MSFEPIPDDRHNHFNLLRIIAACTVIFSHSWPLTRGFEVKSPLETFIGFSVGIVAVTAFFAISGYFIFASLERRRSNWDFISARIARIYPGLIVVVALSVFVMGPLVTDLSIGQYFTDPGSFLYPVKVLTFIDAPASLPGAFASNPISGGANGSLWTLFYEVACYIGLFVSVGLLRMPVKWIILAYLPIYALAMITQNFVIFAWFSMPFIIGMTAYRYRSRRFLRWWVAAGLLAAAMAVSFAGYQFIPLWSVAIAYCTLWLGFAKAPSLLAYNELGDYSYGTYIYGWPVQQCLVHVMPGIQPPALICLSLPIAVLLAMLSWRFVEKPGLRLRRTFTRSPSTTR